MRPEPAQYHTWDLIAGWEAEEEFGVPQQVIRQWATRKKINKFPGHRPADGTMYARPEVAAMAETYKATPQRAPKPRRLSAA